MSLLTVDTVSSAIVKSLSSSTSTKSLPVFPPCGFFVILSVAVFSKVAGVGFWTFFDGVPEGTCFEKKITNSIASFSFEKMWSHFEVCSLRSF